VESKGDAPRGIFPWYVPGHDSFLGEFPLSHDALIVPKTAALDGPLNLQIEPEVGLACHVVWDGDTVVTLRPFALGAFNDCSIRRPNARKISDKKNWGPASKGVAREFFKVGDLTPDGPTATLRLLCHLRTPTECSTSTAWTVHCSVTPTTARYCWTGLSSGWPTRRGHLTRLLRTSVLSWWFAGGRTPC